MASAQKRKAELDASSAQAEKKAKKTWRTNPRASVRQEIEPGDVGIWATCNKGKEGKCVAELKDLFQEYAMTMYGTGGDGVPPSSTGDDIDDDVGALIERELDELRKPETTPLFTSIRLDTPCLIFFKVSPAIEPVSFVHKICSVAAASAQRKQSRSVKRLTPMSLIGKATEAGLEEVGRQVLAPHFHEPQPLVAKKFAIRSNIRNHSSLTREGVIKQVAAIVGPKHTVDLKSYDLLILVEIYKNICGVGVVGSDYEKLRRYNLAEIFEPTPRPEAPSSEGPKCYQTKPNP